MSGLAAASPWASIRRSLAFRLALPAVVAGAMLVGVTGEASAQEIVVRAHPPEPRVEVAPRAPSPHHFWVHGYWGYHPHAGYAWYGGHWEAPREGYGYEPSHWSERGGYWHFVGGHWYRR